MSVLKEVGGKSESQNNDLQFDKNVLGRPLLNNSLANWHREKTLASVAAILRSVIPKSNNFMFSLRI
jgi:hypothetical protein